MKPTISLFLSGFISLILFNSGLFAQTTTDTLKVCGYSKSYVMGANSVTSRADLQQLYSMPSVSKKAGGYSPYMLCGRFKFTFEDVLLQTGYGFDNYNDAMGSAWAECLFNAAAYIQGVFDVPPGDGSLIEIFVQKSWTGSNPPSDPHTLAAASPLYTSAAFIANQPGLYGGNLRDHMVTGIDPDPQQYDAILTFNANYNFLLCYQNQSCAAHDFYSIALHELTHAMGWASLIEEDPSTLLPKSIYGNNQFSLYDGTFLHVGNIISGPFINMVDNSNPANPVINMDLPSNVLRDGNIWYTNELAMSATHNQNDKVNYGPNSYNTSGAPNTISHFFNNQMSYVSAEYISPQFTKKFVMKPAFGPGQLRREYTKTEMIYLNQMGYVFKPAFLAQSTLNPSFTNAQILSNRHPYTTQPLFQNWPEVINVTLGFPLLSYYYFGGMDDPAATVADGQIDNCQVFTLALSSIPRLKDADNDPLFIFPGSLYNIRGCGNGGNNHNGLTVSSSPSGDVITYTPRQDFIGRAQFGFHLYDGKEKGAFVVFTIDVTGCHVPPANMIVNGNFEEGEEVQTMTSPVIDNYPSSEYYMNKRYPGRNQINSDGMVFQNGTSLIVRNAWGCNPSATGLNHTMNSLMSFDNGAKPNANVATHGDRYLNISCLNDNYFRLNAPVSTCTSYILEFDYNQISAKEITFGFTNQPDYHTQTSQFDNPVTYTLPATGGNWQHFSIPVNYCAQLQNNWFVIKNPEAGGELYIDNLSLLPDTTPHTFSISPIATQTICAGAAIVLNASVISPFCTTSYTWLPGGENTHTITTSPFQNTTYTISANDGCTSYSTTATVSIASQQQCGCSAISPVVKWQSCFGGSSYETAFSVISTNDGGFIACGYTGSTDGDVSFNYGNSDFWIIKLDATGTKQWEKTYGGLGSEEAQSIQQTSDGGYIIAGKAGWDDGDVTGNHGGSDYWIVKTDASGNLMWQKSLGGSADDIAKSIQQTTDGGYIVAGYSESNNQDVSGNHGSYDFWIVKLDQQGSIVWQKSLGGSGIEKSHSVQQTNDGGYIIAGYSFSNNGNVSINYGLADYWIVKLDQAGTLQWQKSLGGNGMESAQSIKQTTDGGYIIGGSSSSLNNGDVTGGHGGFDYWAVKLDINGMLVWQKTLGGYSHDECFSIQQTIDGGYIMGGFSETNSGDITGNHGGFDYWLVKINASGTLSWQNSLGGTQNDNGMWAQQTSAGKYIMAGVTFSDEENVSGYHGAQDFWIVEVGCNNTVTGLENTVTDNEISVYPNPTQHNVIIKTTSWWINKSFELSDQLGRIIKKGHVHSHEEILYVGDLANGMYFLKFSEAPQKTIKIIKH